MGIMERLQQMADAAMPPDPYAEGYRAGRIAALREVGCWKMWAGADCRQRPITYAQWCRRCRLLAEAESGEDAGEVGDDR